MLNEQLEKQLSDSSLLNLVMPAVHDAMQRRPRGTYEEAREIQPRREQGSRPRPRPFTPQCV